MVEGARPVEHRLFAGKLARENLGFRERAMVHAVRAPEGDFRDWEAIHGFARDIAERLRSGA